MVNMKRRGFLKLLGGLSTGLAVGSFKAAEMLALVTPPTPEVQMLEHYWFQTPMVHVRPSPEYLAALEFILRDCEHANSISAAFFDK